MDSRTRSVVNAFEDNEDLYELALTEVVGLMTHAYEVENRLEERAGELDMLPPGRRIDWSLVIDYFQERAAAEFIRSELGRNQPSDESAHEVYLEQAIAVLDSLIEPGQ